MSEVVEFERSLEVDQVFIWVVDLTSVFKCARLIYLR